MPIIGSDGDYKQVLADAERLSSSGLQKIANDEEISAKDRADLTAASAQFQGLIAFEPGKFAPYLALGMIYRGLGNLEDSERMLKQCLNNLPKSTDPAIVQTAAEAKSQLSKVLLAQGKSEDALTEANLAVETDRQNPSYLVTRASALIQLKRMEEAKADLKEALKMDPTLTRASGMLRLIK
ncbi:MAG: hypothetical protein H7Y17_09940 [Chlorobia bacterium]|nr:hypothetical protein [Fimbriimonadaceae bacterium]